MRKAPEIMKIELYTFKVFRAIKQLSFLIDYYIKGKAAREFKFKLLHWGGHYTFLHYTFAFFVYGVVKKVGKVH